MSIKRNSSSITLKQFIINSIIGLICIYIFVNYMFVPALQITYETVDEVLICDSMTYVSYTFKKGSYIDQAKYYLLLIPILAIAVGVVESLAKKKIKTITNLVLSFLGSIITGFTWLDLSLQVKSEIFSKSGNYGTNATVGWYLGLIFFVLLTIYYLVNLIGLLPKKEKKAKVEVKEENISNAEEIKNDDEVQNEVASEEIKDISESEIKNDDKE